MSVTAKFIGDFNNFNQQIDKAVLKLSDFGTAAKNVDRDLSRVGNSFSGQKIIQDAALAAKAVADIGGASKLTESEARRLSSTINEAMLKFKALGKEAPESIQKLHKELQPLPAQMSTVSTAATQVGNTFKSMFGAVALANIASQAVLSLGRNVAGLAVEGARMAELERSFKRLSESVGETDQAMLKASRQGTRGLVADMELMQAANKAILLGLPVTAKEMRDLGATAVTLGKAMGQGAAKSMDDLITALGRSSPMILDNLGLTVKVGEANEKYAEKLGKSVSAMSDAEKKTAFYNAALEAARIKTAELGGATATAADRVDQLTAAWSNFWRKAGQGGGAALNTLFEGLQTAAAIGTLPFSGSGGPFRAADTNQARRAVGFNERFVSDAASALGGTLAVGRPFAAIAPTDAEIQRLKAVTDPLEHAVKTTKALADNAQAIKGFVAAETALLQGMAAAKGPLFQEKAPQGAIEALERQAFLIKEIAEQNALIADSPLFQESAPASGGSSFLGNLKGQLGSMLEGMTGGNGLKGLLSNLGGGVIEGLGNMLSAGVTTLITKGLGALGKGIKNLFGAGEHGKVNDMRDDFISAAGGLDALNKKAVEAGTTLDKLLGAKKVKDFEAAVESLRVKFGDFAAESEADAMRLEQAIQRYGFAFEELGPKFQNQRLHEQATELIEDWRVLVGAGLDVALVNDKMGEAVGEFLQTAIRVGGEIPAAMKPILQSMIDQGKLFDENGVAITDLEAAGVSFSETMTEGFDRVVEKLEELIKKLQATGQAIGDLPTSVNIGVPDLAGVGAGAMDLVPMAKGGRGIVKKPTLFLAGEAGQEEFAFSGAGKSFGGGGGEAVALRELRSMREQDRRDRQRMLIDVVNQVLTRVA